MQRVLATQQSALDPAGPQAQRIGTLWWSMFYIMSAVFVAVMIALLLATFRTRAITSESHALIRPERQQELRFRRRVVSAVLLTVVILLGFLVASFLVGRTIYSKPVQADVLTIEVTGHQWWWDVRYSNPTSSQIVTTANEIHIPTGRPVLFKLNSTDVIHSFWAPNLHGKTDLIPGHPTDTWIQANQSGVYRGQCAEFCGYQHAHMAFAIVAEPEEQFRNWYGTQLQSAPAPATSSQVRGQQVFLSRPCVMCHRIQGTDAGGRVGPDLTHIASRQTIAAATLENTREHLANWILDSQTIKPGNRMPPNPLPSDDLNALLDYLQSLK
jgi:cytochrome c oxidase subunit 2